MGNGNKAEMLIAVCAVLTSVVALFVAWDQGRVMRAQQHGAVYPVLQVDGFTSSTPRSVQIGLHVTNSGVGPALVESVDAYLGDKALDDLIGYRNALPGSPDINWTTMTGRALAPGNSVVPLELSWSREDLSDEQLLSIIADGSVLSFVVCYCSVFERCWKTEGLGTARAERVERCERSDRDIFEELSRAPRSPSELSGEVE